MTRRSSGWLTVINTDELDEAEGWLFMGALGGGRAMRNPLGLQECLGGSGALGEHGHFKFIMDVKYFMLRKNSAKE